MDALPPLPKPLVPLLLLLLDFLETHAHQECNLDCLELFCGKKAITLAQQKAGLQALGYDKIHSKSEDFCSPEGFQRALEFMMRLKPGGFLRAAPECQTWDLAVPPADQSLEDQRARRHEQELRVECQQDGHSLVVAL